MESVNTCIHVSPIMRQPEAHVYLYKLLGKKINKVIQDYLVAIDYWFLNMNESDRQLFFT